MAEREPLLGHVQYDESKDTEEEDDQKEGCYVPRRYILVLLLFFGTANSFAVRVNFNVALLAMVNDTQDANINDTSHHCPGKPNFGNSTTKKGGGDFLWSSDLQSVLLGAFYYGYPVLQPFAGVLSEKIGPKRLIVFAGASAGFLNLLMPVVARWNVYALVVLRGVLGIGLGPLWPCLATMLSRWTMRTERTRMFATCNAGLYVGTVVSQSISGVLCDSNFLGGWPSVFYLFGVLSLGWTVVFWFFTADSPSKHPSISREEREQIEAHTGDVKYRRPPYGSIIRSVPVWCFFIMLLMDITSYDVLFTYLPLYMKRVLHFDISASAGLSSVPYVISLVVTYLAGYTADVIRNRGWLRTMWIRRIYTFGGDMLPALCVLVITFLNCDRTMVVFFFILAVSLSGLNNGGFNVNMFDLAPRYAGTIYGVINGLSNIGGFVGPLAVGAFTKNSSNVQSWHYVFYLIVALYSLGTFVFCVFGSAELQPWAEPRTETSIDVPEDGPNDPEESPNQKGSGTSVPSYGTECTVAKAEPPEGLDHI